MHFTYSSHLPVHEKHDEIVALIRSERVVIVSGETGCGKTTQMPLLCLEAGRGSNGKIGCTQPRRVAAQSLFRFVESRFDPQFRKQVGYKVRFDEKIEAECIVKFMTDGILLAEASTDPLLSEYDTIILDEVHERSVNIDLLLGIVKILLAKRDDLHIVIASATMNTHLFSRYFNDAPVVSVSGRLYPVEILYRPVIELWKGESIDSYIEGVIVNVEEIVQSNQSGDILVFLPTVDDVYDAVNKLKHRIDRQDIEYLALHSRSSSSSQRQVFEKLPHRKVIVATNVAETSITVPGIRFVIDSGLARVLRYDTNAAISRMPIEKISQSSAQQRAGRCGRVDNGVCIRLYSEQDFSSRPLYTQPEIKRSNLSGILLRLHRLDHRFVSQFPFMLRPLQNAINDGLQVLRELGAFDRNGHLSFTGRKMAELPLDPPVSRMLLFSIGNGTFREMAVIAAALSIDGLVTPENEESGKGFQRFRDSQSDFVSFLNMWRELNNFKNRERGKYRGIRTFCNEFGLSYLRIREWVNIHEQIISFFPAATEIEFNGDNKKRYEAIHKSILSGMSGGVAVRCGEYTYEGVSTGNIRLFPGSTLFRKNPQWIVCHEIVETGHIYGRYAAVIKPQWIESLFRNQCRYIRDEMWYDPQSGEVRGREEVIWKGLVLIKNRVIDSKKYNRRQACECFVREALVNKFTVQQFDFISHNEKTIQTIRQFEQKVRKELFAGTDNLFDFYIERLAEVCSDRELIQKIQSRGNDRFLCASVDDLSLETIEVDINTWPDYHAVLGYRCACTYVWHPFANEDGLTITVPEMLFRQIPGYYWDWVHSVFVKERLVFILSMLNYSEKETEQLVADFVLKYQFPQIHFVQAVAEFFSSIGTDLEISDIEAVLPVHLWCRIAVLNEKGMVIKVVRTSVKIDNRTPKSGMEFPTLQNSQLLLSNQLQWEGPALLSPVAFKTGEQNVPVCAYPAFYTDKSGMVTRYFLEHNQAISAQIHTTTQLIEHACAEDLTWAHEEIKLKIPHYQKLMKLFQIDDMESYLFSLIIRIALGKSSLYALSETQLHELITDAHSRIVNINGLVLDLVEEVTSAFEQVTAQLKKRMQKTESAGSSIHEEMLEELHFFKNVITSEATPIYFFEMIPQFLSAFTSRIDAAYYDYRKYCLRMQDVYAFRQHFEVLTVVHQLQLYEYYLTWRHRWYTEQYCATLFSSSTIKKKNSTSLDTLRKKLDEFKNGSNGFEIEIGNKLKTLAL
jgi:ATP-dependent helicase HrpA